MPLTSEELSTLLQLLDLTQAEEIDCSQLLERVASFVEHVERREPGRGFEDVAQHLSVCPECREEFEALRQAFHDDCP